MSLESTINRLSEAHSVRAFKQIPRFRGKSQEVVPKIESWLNDHRNEFQIGHFEKLKKMNCRVTLLWNQDLGAVINRIFLKCLLPDEDSIAKTLSPFVNRSMKREDLEILIRTIKEIPDSHPTYHFWQIVKFFDPSEKVKVPLLCSCLTREDMRGIDIKIIFFAVHRLNLEVRSNAIALTSSLMADDPKITNGYEVTRFLKLTSEILQAEGDSSIKFNLLKIELDENKTLKSLRQLPLPQRAVVIDAAHRLSTPSHYDWWSDEMINTLISIPAQHFSRVLKLTMPFSKVIHQNCSYYANTFDKIILILCIMRDFQLREPLSLKAVESAASKYFSYNSSNLTSYLKLIASFSIDEQEKICPFIAEISENLERFAVYLEVFQSIDKEKRLLALKLLKDYTDGKDSPIVNFANDLKKRLLWGDSSSLPVLLLSAYERGPSFRKKYTTKLSPASNRLESRTPLHALCQAISEIPPVDIDSLIKALNVNPNESAPHRIKEVRLDLIRYDLELLLKAYNHIGLIENDKNRITMMERAKFIPQHRWEDYFKLFRDDRVWRKNFYSFNWKIIFTIHPDLKEDCLKFLSHNPEMKKEFLTYLDTKKGSG